MPAATIQQFFRIDNQQLIDRWLRFAPPIQARYDSEYILQRKSDLRLAIYIGLVLYNVYNITSIVLLADILQFSIALRIGIITPTSLALAWLIGRTSLEWTERLVLIGVLNAYFGPVFLFWLTREPLGLFTFGELPLTIVFANMLLALRFRGAAIFTAGALGATLVAVSTKDDLEVGLRFAFAVQIFTVCIFSLYANHSVERRRCGDYITALGAKLQAENANIARQRFQNLSRTDALTELPNRRHLMEKLDEWFAAPNSITLIMIDIDHFKLYNDTLGHPAGDDCLRRVSQVFTAAARSSELFCARFGGEEFTFAMLGATELEAVRLARELVQGIEALGIPHPSRSDGLGVVTISVGLARKGGSGTMSPSELFAIADRALYSAKQRGRNQFMIGSDDMPVIARRLSQ